MPKSTPSARANDRFSFRADNVGADYAATTALTPRRAKAILQGAEIAGDLGPMYGLYDRMETTDTRFGGLVGQLRAAIGGFDLKVTQADAPEGPDKRLAEDYANVMREVVANLDAQSVTKAFCDPYITGARLYRLRWNLESFSHGRKLWIPTDVEPVDGRALRMEMDFDKESYGMMKVRTKANSDPDGRLVDDLPLGAAIFLEAGSGRGRYDRMGVARKCLPWYVGLQFVQSWWVQYIEGYAAPLRIARHPRGIDPKAKMEMEKFLQVLGQHGYAMFPNDMEVQLIEANRQGTITTYGDFIAKGHEEYAVALLGQAETTSGSSGGSYAKSVVSNSIRYEVMQDVAGIVARGWQKLAELVVKINYGDKYVRRLLPTVAPVLVSPTEALTKARVAVMAQDNGVAIPESYWFEQVVPTDAPRDGEYAVLYGQRFQVGVEPRPEPQAQQAASQDGQEGSDERSEEGSSKKADADASNPARQNRSVAENGTPAED